ncbi:hypothetical protein BDV23DRAFT_171768 [Aspergillus alliaceus]|uniref:Altered inheritance of mitochondria protein 6 n=1 Tax=Petromyces alliaceus TaxID=209559 RepID=A0A5N7CBM4_PETAA|nr:hypothetical protein BDV23DRAFT_171768 [Aspergillus alliaceus]
MVSVDRLTPPPKDFSQGITPVRCYSHNNYWHKVPLFDALTAGYIGRQTLSLSADRTLQSLYIKPLITILTRINQGANISVSRSGVFKTLSNASLTLLINIKTDRHTFWPVLVNADTEYRDVFTSNNSYYASASLRKAAGIIWPWGPSRHQKETIKRIIDTAAARGLVSQFWGIPGWPVYLRMKLWGFLVESGIGTLNVDKLFEATQWIRDRCTVAGWVLC